MTATIFGSPEYALQQNSADLYPPTIRASRHLLSFLQWRFSLCPVGAYRWVPEEEQSQDRGSSEIFISADTPLPTQNVGYRPAITVMRSQAAFQGTGIGDVAHHNWATGGKTRMDLVPTTLLVNVLSQNPLVAERLAWFVQDQVFSLREEIVRTEKCIFSIGQRTALSAPGPAGQLVDQNNEDWSVVSMALPTFLQHVTVENPLNRPMVEHFGLILKNKR